MTVGIAVLCQEGAQGEHRYVILTSDRMITGGDIEYEPDKAKLYWLTPTGHIVALIAGDSAVQSAIGQAAQLQIAAEGVTDVKSAAEIFATQMADHSRSMAEREHLYPLGQDLSSFVPTSA
ncbi:MAG: hypothetical protein IIB28_04325, partial [Chloroflexi bacterium]|nr:hypothetical protein [Chloroflexota bacterium]